MSYLRLAPALVALATLAAVPTAHASFPAGVWGLVDQVTLEPDANNPKTIRIDGTFIVANQKPDFAQYPGYGEPQVGYMYYACTDKQLATCVMEWKELLAVVGKEDNCRGWGDQSFPDNGSVRPAPQQPIDPDLYPISMGVLQGFSPCEALRAWQMNQGTTGETGEPGTSTTGESGTTTGESGTVTGDTTGRTSGDTVSASGETASTSGESASGDTASGDPETSGKTVTGDPETNGEGGDATGLSSGDDPTEGAGDATAAETTAGDATGSEGDSGTLDDEKGCACATSSTPGQHTLGALAMLAGFGLLRRRRRAV